MKISKLVATALLATSATAITTVTAYAQDFPADPQAAPSSFHGSEAGMSYTTALDPAGGRVVATLDEGRFTLADDGDSVIVTDPAGTVMATVPLAVQVAGQPYALRPSIENDGRTMALAPIGAPLLDPAALDRAQLHYADEAADLARHQYNAGVGALIGLGVGLLAGVWFFFVGAIPGAVIGAGIGALIGWFLP
ncbi:hypothetical protein [Nocardia stercoris]|uniref:DUF8020 domain-containing protein n=1 Tax=Nocardia stercoris TaxID=2483361 RepID=A0A3M2L747_9NOCA|nr:hypothetical protein [Nocardia stercoris]RMI30358.1 hypothetical protein EBN03_22190 [Nocardia stercoris]